MLHEVPQLPGPHLYCGPTAICAVTGLDQRDVLLALHRYRKQPLNKPIVDTTLNNLIGAMALLGWRTETYLVEGNLPSFARFRKHDMNNASYTAILSMTGHFAAVTYDEYVCNHTNGKIIPIYSAPNSRRRIEAIIEVEKL